MQSRSMNIDEKKEGIGWAQNRTIILIRLLDLRNQKKIFKLDTRDEKSEPIDEYNEKGKGSKNRTSGKSYNRVNPDLIGLRICVYVIMLRFLCKQPAWQRDLKVKIFHRKWWKMDSFHSFE